MKFVVVIDAAFTCPTWNIPDELAIKFVPCEITAPFTVPVVQTPVALANTADAMFADVTAYRVVVFTWLTMLIAAALTRVALAVNVVPTVNNAVLTLVDTLANPVMVVLPAVSVPPLIVTAPAVIDVLIVLLPTKNAEVVI